MPFPFFKKHEDEIEKKQGTIIAQMPKGGNSESERKEYVDFLIGSLESCPIQSQIKELLIQDIKRKDCTTPTSSLSAREEIQNNREGSSQTDMQRMQESVHSITRENEKGRHEIVSFISGLYCPSLSTIGSNTEFEQSAQLLFLGESLNTSGMMWPSLASQAALPSLIYIKVVSAFFLSPFGFQ